MKLQRKALTPDQFKRANKLTALSISLVYLIFLILNFTSKITVFRSKLIFAGIYALWYAMSAYVVYKHVKERKAMLMLAIGFELSYTLLIFTTSTASIMLIFPVLMAITVYLNEVIIMCGTVGAFILILVKSTVLRFSGMDVTADYVIINVALFGLIITAVGGFKAVRLLINFSNEETDQVKELLENQREVAKQVGEIVSDVTDEFTSVLKDLHEINDSVDQTTAAIGDIANGAEETSGSASQQATMTSEIQRRLEKTSGIAAEAKDTSDELKQTIETGKSQSDELEKQSQIVDDYTKHISDTIAELVTNVSKVSDITNTILSISSQTNLLALNASIEAARAGDAGRGFAVVAEEIRKLAEETKSSTEMITGIMHDLHDVSDRAKTALDGSVQSIAVQRDKVKQVHQSFTAVDEGIVVLAEGIHKMNHQVKAVLQANNTIVTSIDTLANISQEMSANAVSSAEDVHALKDKMDHFTGVIETTSEKMHKLKEAAEV